jgi:hypothetical protein
VFRMILSQQTATVSLNSINRLGSVADRECVSSEIEQHFYILFRRHPVFEKLILA